MAKEIKEAKGIDSVNKIDDEVLQKVNGGAMHLIGSKSEEHYVSGVFIIPEKDKPKTVR